MNEESEKQREIESRIIRLKLTDKTFITGQININREELSHDKRLSDLLTKNKEQFLILFSATEMRDDLDKGIKHGTIFINKHHILWAAPEEDQK
ncbi:conserved hypothetical protein [Desulfamplus magnetovallimortis]|uniref:Uncharacterized protein n=1 Tax=Desulfamplus magnetovallimortis TaxID=1246637 RepID=L0R422_9BACT|nr:hypothetical protein [Desulfamplus magnetovallimortis]CCO06783.1 conserved hypothetical protein [Desulfamplus magnetovallimortis BW-1]SLM32834.1 conserved hypothetical protein [Desulfamplus magnetovallimortis]